MAEPVNAVKRKTRPEDQNACPIFGMPVWWAALVSARRVPRLSSEEAKGLIRDAAALNIVKGEY